METQFDKPHKSLTQHLMTTQPVWLRLLNLLMLWHLRISAKSFEHLTVSLVTEQKEKEKKQLNVNAHKLDESCANNGPSEKIMILNLFFRNTYLGVTVTITNAFHLRKSLTNHDWPR